MSYNLDIKSDLLNQDQPYWFEKGLKFALSWLLLSCLYN